MTRYKFDIYTSDRINGVKKSQSGAGCTTAVAALNKGFITLSKCIKPNTFKVRVVVNDVKRNVCVLDTGIIPIYDQTKI